MDRFRMLPSYHYEDNTDGVLLKSVGKPLRDYKIEGNCFQDGVPSPDNPIEVQCCGKKTKNLLPFPYVTASTTRNGITVTVSDDGSICIDGTSTAATSFYLFNDKENLIPGFKIGDTITLSKNPNDESQHKDVYFTCNYYNSSGTMEQGIVCSNYLTYSGTISEEWVGVGCYIHVPVGRTLNNLVLKPQIELGDTATEYEPYGYKVPVTVEGKNLNNNYDWVTGTNNTGFNVTNNSSINLAFDNSFIEINSMPAWSGIASPLFPIEMFRSISYEVNQDSEVDDYVNYNIIIQLYDENCDKLSYKTLTSAPVAGIVYKHNRSDVNLTSGTKYFRLCVVSRKNTIFDLKFNNILITDRDDFDYEPYFEPKSYNIYLNEPLRKVGDYADYVDFKNSKVMRHVVKSVLTGDESKWGLPTVVSNGYSHYRILPFFNEAPVKAFICSHFEAYPETIYSANPTARATTYPNSNQLIFTISNDIADSHNQTDMTAWLEWVKTQYENGNPIEVFYILTTSTETLISLPQILTEKHTNVISVGTALQPSTVTYQYYKGGK